jgi:hypothetical protein
VRVRQRRRPADLRVRRKTPALAIRGKIFPLANTANSATIPMIMQISCIDLFDYRLY